MKRSVHLLSRQTRRTDFNCPLFISCVYVWMIFTATNFDISSSMFWNAQVKYIPCRIDRNHFPNFNKLWQPLRLVKNSVTNRSWSLIYIQYDLTLIEFVFKLVVACSFWVARVIKNTLRKPFEFKSPEVRFNRKQTSMIAVPYNKLLTNLASSIRTGKYWPSVVFVRTLLRSVRTSTTSGQYSPVRPSRSARWKTRGRGPGVRGTGYGVRGPGVWKTRGLVENTGSGGKYGV